LCIHFLRVWRIEPTYSPMKHSKKLWYQYFLPWRPQSLTHTVCGLLHRSSEFGLKGAIQFHPNAIQCRQLEFIHIFTLFPARQWFTNVSSILISSNAQNNNLYRDWRTTWDNLADHQKTAYSISKTLYKLTPLEKRIFDFNIKKISQVS